MKFTVYPTERDRANRQNGVQLTGQVWSEAPGAGNQWVIPEGCREAILVTTRANSNGGKSFAVGPVPVGAERSAS